MEKNELKDFFEAKSIVLFDAEEETKTPSSIYLKNLSKIKGKLIPLNKKEEKLAGKKTYKNLKDYKKKIDLAIIPSNTKNPQRAINQCRKKEIKNIILNTSTKSERENKKLSRIVQRINKKSGTKIFGPENAGLLNPKKNMNILLSDQEMKKGHTVFLTQSVGLANYILDRGFGTRGIIILNDNDPVDFADWINYFSEDKKTKKIVCFIKKLRKGKEFVEACKESKKEIIVVRPQKTQEENPKDEILDPFTENKIYEGAFKQAGIKFSKTLIRAFGEKEDPIIYKLKGKKIKIISNSDGAILLINDQLKRAGYEDIETKKIPFNSDDKTIKRILKNLEKNYDSVIIAMAPTPFFIPEKIVLTITESKFKHKTTLALLGNKSLQETLPLIQKEMINFSSKPI